MWRPPAYYTQTYYPSYDAYRDPRHVEQQQQQRQRPPSRSYRRDHHIVPAPLNTPLYLPAPPLPPAAFAPAPPPNTQPPFGHARIMDQAQYGHQYASPFANRHHSSKDSDSDTPRGILKPQPAAYPVPHPTMYPGPPPNMLVQQQQESMPPQQLHHPSHLQHIPTQPPGAYASQPLPPGARVISPPRFPTDEDLKYKCSICGRSRSARYHYKHPLFPGQLPGKTVCRKCRDQATDSEDSASSDTVADRKHRQRGGRGQRRARSRSRATSIAAEPRRARSRRGRPYSRGEWSEDEYEDEIRDTRRSYSRSSSLEVEPIRSRSHRASSRRPASPSVEIIRYVERPARPRPARRTIYIENERPRRQDEYEWEDESEDYYERPLNRNRRSSRPPSVVRVVRRRASESAVRGPLATEHHHYFDEHDLAHDKYRPPARSRFRGASRSRVASTPYRASQQHTSESNEGFYDDTRRSSYRRPRSLVPKGRSRSGYRSPSRDEDRAYRSVSIVPHAPEPPDWSAEDEHREQSRPTRRDYRNENPGSAQIRHNSRARSRSRSRSADHSQLASEILLPGDEITMIEGHGPKPAEYEWYDKDGMRVRVREI